MKVAATTSTSKKRGRPGPRIFFPHEVADLVAVELEWLLNALDKSARTFFRGAWKDEEKGWQIPERDVRALLGPGLPKLFTVRDFAELISVPYQTLYGWIKCGAVPHRMIFGEMRISEETYWKLPTQRPATAELSPKRAAARRSFFSRKSAVSGTNTHAGDALEGGKA